MTATCRAGGTGRPSGRSSTSFSASGRRFDLLQTNGFRVFVCSGGGRDFMRVFAEETWGVNKENVIGSAAEYTYTADGGIVRGEEILGSLNLGPGKPEYIFAQTGRLPSLRRRERRRGHRDARSREVRSADQPPRLLIGSSPT